MPRTLPPELEAAMDSGVYEPYIRVILGNDIGDDAVTVQPLGYKLTPLAAEITIPRDDIPGGLNTANFRILRGALINGAPVTITSIFFTTINVAYNGKFATLTGQAILDTGGIALGEDPSYQAVIEAAVGIGSFSFTASYEGAAAWKAYQFYPDGRTVVLRRNRDLFTVLRQKYLIFAAENGWHDFANEIYFFVATDTRATDYNITDVLFNNQTRTVNKKVIWRDETGTVHSLGSGNNLHNLGYLESTASPPPNLGIAAAASPQSGTRSSKLPVHLKYMTGDKVQIDGDGTLLNKFIGRITVTEVLDLASTPAWYMLVEPVVWFAETEGGALPSTIEAAAPYTPLVTGSFDHILSANDNNLQAAMETIDDHNHDLDYADITEPIAAAHIAGTAASHAASAISFDHTGLVHVTATNVQAAIEELDAAAGGGGAGSTGWLPYAYPLGFAPTTTPSGSVSLPANGGSMAVPIFVTSKLMLTSVTLRNTSASLPRAWRWDLYVQDHQTGEVSENVLRRVAQSNGSDSFTPSAAGIRTLAASVDTELGPGTYWLVVQCTHASNPFVPAGIPGVANWTPNTFQTKTTSNPNGDTLDFVAATWTKSSGIPAVRLDGIVFGQTAAF